MDYDCSSNCDNVYHEPYFFSFGMDSSYYSDESGLEWHYIPLDAFYGFPSCFSPGENCLLVAGGMDANKIDISYNMGSDWMDISEGLPPAGSQFPIDNAIINGQRIFTEVEYKGLWYRDDLVTGINNDDISEKNEIKVWPNPFSDYINIKIAPSLVGNGQLRILDLQGRQVYNQKITFFTETTIYPNNLTNPGFYILQILIEDQCWSVKLIKK